jgi:hypothetical protein
MPPVVSLDRAASLGAESDESFEPEYEVETVTIAGRIHLHVLSLVPPPLEYMSTLHSENKEISGRQVWTGSLLLANVICQHEFKSVLDNKRVLDLGCGTGKSGALFLVALYSAMFKSL